MVFLREAAPGAAARVAWRVVTRGRLHATSDNRLQSCHDLKLLVCSKASMSFLA